MFNVAPKLRQGVQIQPGCTIGWWWRWWWCDPQCTQNMFIDCWPQDISAEALPDSSDHRHRVSSSKAYAQIGSDAAVALLSALMAGSTASQSKAICIVDVFANTGDFTLAFLKMRESIPTQCFYYGMCESQVAADWLENMIKDHLTEMYQEGKLQLPSGAKLKDLRPPMGATDGEKHD